MSLGLFMGAVKRRHALLSVLLDGPGYGLSLIERAMAEHAVTISQGAVYPFLRELERDGLLESEERAEALEIRGGRPRRYYRLTDKGLQAAKDARAMFEPKG